MQTVAELVLAVLTLSIRQTEEISIDGWGISMLILALGLSGIFLLMRGSGRQKDPILNAVSMFLALFTILGQSYMQTQCWDALFSNGTRLIVTLIRWRGYSLIYKNCILFVKWLFMQLPESLWRRNTTGNIEKWLFEKHPFWGVLLLIWLLEIPWLVCFFPGTLEPDARYQILMACGGTGMTGHHPIMVTKLMGKCVVIGRDLFASDSIGVFFYTISQFAMQSLVFAYTMYVLGRMKVPIVLRWGTLAFYCIYPIFPIWGYTMVKDSGYYILIILFVVAIDHLFYECEAHPKWWQEILLIISAVGICCYRKEGCVVVIATSICAFLAYPQVRNLFLMGILSCICCTLLINGVYMRVEGIPDGSAREALSIPLQQTARYVKEHYDEVTPEEVKTLQSVFTVELEQLAEIYNPELSDPVKERFAGDTDSDALKQYFGVWWKQLLKHPETYVQAFLHHTYGYFYPDKSISWEGEDIGVFDIAESDFFDVNFGIKDDTGRNYLEEYARLVKSMPVIGMLYSTGLHTWILLGCVVYLLAGRKYRKLVIYIPGLCTLAICFLSPVNTCVRYMLPIMALLPVHLGWLEYANRNTLQKEE